MRRKRKKRPSFSGLQRQVHTKKQHNFTLGDGPVPASTLMEAPIPNCGAKRATAGPGQPHPCWWHPDLDSLSLPPLLHASLCLSLDLLVLAFSFPLFLQLHKTLSVTVSEIILPTQGSVSGTEIYSQNRGICTSNRKFIPQIFLSVIISVTVVTANSNVSKRVAGASWCHEQTVTVQADRRSPPVEVRFDTDHIFLSIAQCPSWCSHFEW